ncbi:MAG: CoA-transferase [Thermodesulfobacteriota bacterium]
MSGKSKTTTLSEAVARLVRPGMSLVMGAGLEACIPFAAGHEILRQGRKDLTLIGPISDALFDMMAGGGAAGRIIAAWVGNVGTGLGYNFHRAVEEGVPNPIEVINHSNLSVATALDAGAMGVSFGVLRSLFGTTMEKENPDLAPILCPFTGRKHLAVRALTPDLAVIHAQRADELGNTHLWGSLGIVPEAVRASRQVLVTVEEIVPAEVIKSDPNRTLIPGFKVAAVVEEPFGAHPSPVQGYYGHDDAFYMEYAQATRDLEGAAAWFAGWVFGLPDRRAYLKKLGSKRLEGLWVKHPAPAAAVEYGY